MREKRSLSGQGVKLLRPFLIQRDGPNCQLCELPPRGKKPLQIHHKDHNRANNQPENVVLAHADCNAKEAWAWRRDKEHQKMGLTERKRERENTQADTENKSWEARRSIELGPTLELELDRLLAESKGGLTVREAQNRLAKICGCDQQTVARFIDRETVPEGRYLTSERTVSDGRRKRTLQFLSARGPK